MSQTIKLLFASAFLNAICWIILIPVWQYPDEQAHFAQIQFIAEIGGIPKDNQSFDTSSEVALSEKILQTERDELGNNRFTYHLEYTLEYSDSLFGPNEEEIISQPEGARKQMVKNEATLNPPLYYYLGSAVYKIFTDGNLITRVFAIRFMSSIIFLTTIFLAYKIGQIIFKKNDLLPITLASIIAYKPMLIFASTGVLPDTMTNFLFTLFIYICLKILRENITVFRILSLLAVVILGAITRQHFLITLFIMPLVILEQLFVNKKSRKLILLFTAICVLTLYSLSFFIESLSFINRFDYPESSQKFSNPLSNLSYIEHLKWTIKHSVSEVWPWYWGVYKWLSLSLPPEVYQIINRLVPIATIGVLLNLFHVIKKGHKKDLIILSFLLLVPIVYFIAMTTFDYLFRKNNGFSFGIQGRYFFPVIVTHLAILLVGFNTIFNIILKNRFKYAILFLVIMMMAFNLFSLTYVSASYYDFSSLKTSILQISQYKPLIAKGNILYLIFGLSLLSQALFLASYTKYVLKSK